MPHANRPSGPGKPINERRDSVAEQEELEELAGDTTPAASTEPAADDAGRGARHAERAAHTKDDNAAAASGKSSKNSTSRDRPRQS